MRRYGYGGRTGWKGGVLLALVGCLCVTNAQAQINPLTREEAKAQFAHMAREGGYWATSNERYATPDSGEPDEYRMAFVLAPDGNAMRGCMWGAPSPDGASPFWYFFHAWDPTTGSILAYQSSPGGAVAIGRESRAAEGGTEAVQTLRFPGAEDQRVRHLNRIVHADTVESRSFNGSAEAEPGWEPRRAYTWIWRSTREATPC